MVRGRVVRRRREVLVPVPLATLRGPYFCSRRSISIRRSASGSRSAASQAAFGSCGYGTPVRRLSRASTARTSMSSPDASASFRAAIKSRNVAVKRGSLSPCAHATALT